MKHKCFAAVVLAAALLLTGCGGAAAPAAPAGSGAASQSAAGTAVQTAQKERITDQWSLEKTVRGEMIGVMKLSIHVPQLVCDSPDAAALNEELAAMYAAEYMDYESDPDAEVPQGEECSQTEINWDAYWYGDCVSLVIRSHDYDDAPWYYSGWCFDFATGRQITTAEMLQHMGLDPDEVQAQEQRIGAHAGAHQLGGYRIPRRAQLFRIRRDNVQIHAAVDERFLFLPLLRQQLRHIPQVGLRRDALLVVIGVAPLHAALVGGGMEDGVLLGGCDLQIGRAHV